MALLIGMVRVHAAFVPGPTNTMQKQAHQRATSFYTHFTPGLTTHEANFKEDLWLIRVALLTGHPLISSNCPA